MRHERTLFLDAFRFDQLWRRCRLLWVAARLNLDRNLCKTLVLLQEKLLCMRSCLGTCARTNVPLHALPAFSEARDGFEEALVLSIWPSPIFYLLLLLLVVTFGVFFIIAWCLMRWLKHFVGLIVQLLWCIYRLHRIDHRECLHLDRHQRLSWWEHDLSLVVLICNLIFVQVSCANILSRVVQAYLRHTFEAKLRQEWIIQHLKLWWNKVWAFWAYI